MEWPLVGRREELEAAAQALDAGGVVVAGPAGVGKTRLASAILDRARQRDWVTCWATATAAARAIPFGALAHLLPRDLEIRSSRANLLRVAADALLAQAGAEDRRLVAGIDDAHLLDEHSAALVHLLASSGQAVVIATVRAGGRCPDAISRLWRDRVCRRVEIHALLRAEAAELVEAALGGRTAGSTHHRLWEVCRGNPLFLRELLAGAQESGALRQYSGVWRWRDDRIPPGLKDLVQERLAGLSPSQRRAVEVLALAEPVGVEVLEQVIDPGTLEAVERCGLVTERGGARPEVRLSHPLYREVVLQEMPPAATRRICAQLAAIHGDPAKQGDLLRAASWRLKAGDLSDPSLLASAARHALTSLDYELAHRIAEGAAQADGGFEAKHLRVEALIGLGRPAEAEQMLARLGAAGGTERQQALVAQTRALNLSTGLGRGETSLDVLAEAEDALADRELASELAATRASVLCSSGSMADGIAVGTHVLELPGATHRAVMIATGAVALGLLYGGQIQRAVRTLDAAEQRSRPTLPTGGEFELEICRYLAALFSGNLMEALERAETGYERAIEHPGPTWLSGTWAGAVGLALRWRGRPSRSVPWLREATSLLGEADTHGYLSMFLAELAHSHALEGDSEQARAALNRAEASPMLARSAGHLAEARVWQEAAGGEISVAVDRALEQADELGSAGLRVNQAGLLHHTVRLEARDPTNRAGPGLAELADQCDSRLITGYAMHAAARDSGDPDGLVETSEQFEEMGALLYAAETAAQAARLFRRAGRRGSALSAAARGRTLAQRCDGARTPGLSGADQPLPISVREREVAGLAARGLTNREIAERLTISVRTVDNHLHSTYVKLGLDGREQLAGLLRPGMDGDSGPT